LEDIKISIVDDHEMVIQGIEALINNTEGMKVVSSYSNGYTAAANYQLDKPDLILMDVNMPDINGFQTSQLIQNKDPYAKIIMLSMEVTKPYIKKAYNEGIKGFVSKSADFSKLVDIIKSVNEGNMSFFDLTEA